MAAAVVSLATDVSLKRLEAPCAYNRATDDLFHLNDDAFAFLERALAGAPAADADPEFLATCLAEGILVETAAGAPAPATAATAVAEAEPSLRYLLVHLTTRCNLRCGHCYLGDPAALDLPVELLDSLLADFAGGGGLRLLLSGGEPLLHPRFREVNAMLPDHDVRVVLLTNGALLDRDAAARLNVHEVQVSLDGMEAAHDALRGEASFAAALAGLRTAKAAGLQVSVASTVNALDVRDFDDLAELVHDLGVWQWTIDVPSDAGRFAGRRDLHLPLGAAARVLDLASPSGSHGDDGDFTCGAHLAAVMPDGAVCKCGLLPDVCGGNVRGGLQAAWRALPHHRTPTLGETCRACTALPECRGGCRYRAGGLLCGAPDPVQCHRFGVV